MKVFKDAKKKQNYAEIIKRDAEWVRTAQASAAAQTAAEASGLQVSKSVALKGSK